MYFICQTDWKKDGRALAQIRTAVFIHEQGVPEALEWDGLDATARHWIAWSDNAEPIGCLRLLADYHLGRMAVLPEYRGQGVGMALLEAAIGYARDAEWPHIQISAQTHALNFYMKAGFVVSSAPYLDAGIEHRDMVRYL